MIERCFLALHLLTQRVSFRGGPGRLNSSLSGLATIIVRTVYIHGTMAVLLKRDSQQRLLTSPAELTGGHRDPNYECRPDRIYVSDVPDDFKYNKTAMCGLSFPSETPWTNMSSCCTGPVQVYHECFQYCTTDEQYNLFGHCIMRDTDLEPPLLTTCNNAALPKARQAPSGLDWILALFWPAVSTWSIYLFTATFCLLVACLVAYQVTASTAVRRRLWTCFGLLFTLSVVMAVFEGTN